MDKTKIDWADASWNPVTGCMHGCEYCYARMICVIKLAQAGVLSEQLICMVTERMECAACELAMRSGLI